MRNPSQLLRQLDTKLGPWLLRVLKILRGRRPTPSLDSVKSVALLKIAAIGDTVLVSALIDDLHAWKPDLEITLFVGRSNFEYAKLLKHVTHLELLDFKKPLQFFRTLWRRRYDLFIDTDSWPRISALTTALARSRATIGFKTPGQARHFAYDVQVPHSNDRHELENLHSLLRAAGFPANALPQPPIQWQPVGETAVFHLWPGGKLSHVKEWPLDRWKTLAQNLLTDGFEKILLTGGPNDRERNDDFIAILAPEFGTKMQNLAGRPFNETLKALAAARLLVSVNTGIMHVGAAIGTPTVGLHGPTNPKRWGPVGARTRAILSESRGAGHLNLGFEYPDEVNRMEGIRVETVERACMELAAAPPVR